MDRSVLNSYEEKGLHCPFTATKKGDVEIAQSGAALIKEISQMATVIFETIGAVGDIKVEAFEILGSNKGLIIELSDNQLIGSLFARGEVEDTSATRTLLQELSGQPVVAEKISEPGLEKPAEVVEKEIVEKVVPAVEEKVTEEIEEKIEEAFVEKPEEKPIEPRREKPKTQLEPAVLDKFKETMKEYLGDFTERIFKNQVKAQRINIDEFYDEDARRLVFALGKAAGMIIGPSKGRNMTNKLLDLLK